MACPGGQGTPAEDGVKNDCFIFLRPSHGEEIPDQVRDDSIDQVYFTEHTAPTPLPIRIHIETWYWSLQLAQLQVILNVHKWCDIQNLIIVRSRHQRMIKVTFFISQLLCLTSTAKET